jgi:hypothetical protein
MAINGLRDIVGLPTEWNKKLATNSAHEQMGKHK